MFENETLEERRKRLKAKPLPPDHKLYKIGLVVGGRRLKPSTPTSEDEKPPSTKKELDQALMDEMTESVPHQFGKTDD